MTTPCAARSTRGLRRFERPLSGIETFAAFGRQRVFAALAANDRSSCLRNFGRFEGSSPTGHPDAPLKRHLASEILTVRRGGRGFDRLFATQSGSASRRRADLNFTPIADSTCQVTGAREAGEGPPRRVRVDRRVRRTIDTRPTLRLVDRVEQRGMESAIFSDCLISFLVDLANSNAGSLEPVRLPDSLEFPAEHFAPQLPLSVVCAFVFGLCANESRANRSVRLEVPVSYRSCVGQIPLPSDHPSSSAH